MSVFQAIILGIVQGLTEFLPVSSSGHLVIFNHILKTDLESNLFMNVMLHLGTLIAVIIVYYKLIIRLILALCSMVKKIFTGKFKWKSMNNDENLLLMLIIGLLPLFLLFVPLPFSNGITPKDLADIFSGNDCLYVVAFSLIMTSVLLLLGSFANKNNENTGIGTRKHFKLFDALTVGVAQCFAAVFPGLSRSGSTLAVSELRGINKQSALDYSFVLGVPAIFAAALLELKDAVKEENVLSETGLLPILVGIATSAVVGVFSIKLFKWLLSKDRMYIFVAYTGILGILTLFLSFI